MVGKASFSAAVGGYGSRNAVEIGVGYTPSKYHVKKRYQLFFS
ncbi:YadA-like family protein [Haemophilus influenzae]|nr:YadA-like family protein [Haemophilus influenzae]